MHIHRWVEPNHTLESYNWALGFEDNKFTFGAGKKGVFQNVNENAFEVSTKWSEKGIVQEGPHDYTYDYINFIDYFRKQ